MTQDVPPWWLGEAESREGVSENLRGCWTICERESDTAPDFKLRNSVGGRASVTKVSATFQEIYLETKNRLLSLWVLNLRLSQKDSNQRIFVSWPNEHNSRVFFVPWAQPVQFEHSGVGGQAGAVWFLFEARQLRQLLSSGRKRPCMACASRGNRSRHFFPQGRFFKSTLGLRQPSSGMRSLRTSREGCSAERFHQSQVPPGDEDWRKRTFWKDCRWIVEEALAAFPEVQLSLEDVNSWVEAFLEAATNPQEEDKVAGIESQTEERGEKGSCMVSTWRCFSKVLERAVRQSCRPAGITRWPI